MKTLDEQVGTVTADATAVSLRGLRKTFGDVTAVDGIDLDLAEGEFFSMLGPSGSGKTTVLRGSPRSGWLRNPRAMRNH